MKIWKFNIKLNRKLFAFIGIIIVLILVGFFIFPKQENQQPELTTVKRMDISQIVSSSGSLTGKETVNLKFKSTGLLAYLNVAAGDKVSANDSIAGLDTQLLEINLQQALNTFRDKQAIAEKVEDEVKNHSSDETFSQKATRTTAQAVRDSAYDEVKAAQKALDDANLYTPIAGIITQAPFVTGQNVSASDLIAQVVDFTSIYFDSEIDEADIGKILLKQKAEVTLDAYVDKVFKGEVSQIIPQTKTTSSGATVVTVRIKLETSELTPINGLSGQASIILSEAKNVLTIPQEALRGDNAVFIQTGKGTNVKKVTPGIKSDTDVEIKEGLNEGDKVFLNPPASGNGLNRNRGLFGGVLRFLGGGRR